VLVKPVAIAAVANIRARVVQGTVKHWHAVSLTNGSSEKGPNRDNFHARYSKPPQLQTERKETHKQNAFGSHEPPRAEESFVVVSYRVQ
jgi:hypothetical protein